MAKKRGGEGSNLGLIMTLVFFILTTVVLGVTTYMGYSEVDKAVEAKKGAEKKAADLDKEKDFYRFAYRVSREYMGHSVVGEKDRQLLAQEKDQFDKGSLAYASAAGGAGEELKAFLTKVKGDMPWNGATEMSPLATYETRLQAKDKMYATLARTADRLASEKNEQEEKVKNLQTRLDDAKRIFDTQVVDLRKKANDDRNTDRKEIEDLRTYLKDANEKLGRMALAKADVEKERDKLASAYKTEKSKMSMTLRDLRDVREDRDRLKDDVTVLSEKYGFDRGAQEAERLDARATEELKNWKKDWKVILLDRRGTMPYINLGSADKLQPQTTFSIHSRSLDGKMTLTPKGTLEVVRVIGPHLARARVTSTRDPKNDPIVKGDALFSATWDPDRPKHVAIVGLVDLGGEGVESSEDFRKLLTRQGVVVDAYIDTKNAKAPALKGDVTSRTDYLILGDSLDGARSDKKNDKEFTTRFDKLNQELKLKAQNNGVTILTLRRYLDMIGYKPPKVSTTSEYRR